MTAPLDLDAELYALEAAVSATELDAYEAAVEMQTFSVTVPPDAKVGSELDLRNGDGLSILAEVVALGSPRGSSGGTAAAAFDVEGLLCVLRRPGNVSVADRTAGFVAALARARATAPPTAEGLATLFGSLRLSFYAVDVARGLVEAVAVAEETAGLSPDWEAALKSVDAVVAAANACQPMVRADVLRVLAGGVLSCDADVDAAIARVQLPEMVSFRSPRRKPPPRAAAS